MYRVTDKSTGVHHLRLIRAAEKDFFLSKVQRTLFGEKKEAVKRFLKWLRRPKRKGGKPRIAFHEIPP